MAPLQAKKCITCNGILTCNFSRKRAPYRAVSAPEISDGVTVLGWFDLARPPPHIRRFDQAFGPHGLRCRRNLHHVYQP
jgi:hypothetical protein